MVVMDQYTGRIIGFAVHAENVDGPVVFRMFNDATFRQGWPKRISSDNGLLFQYHQWKANLRVLDIEEIKSLPHVPMSHPFVERLIGSVRSELLDQTFFWTASHLEKKLQKYQHNITTSIGAIPAEPESLQWNQAAMLSAISTSIDGQSIAEVCFSFRRLLELGIRQRQVESRKRTI